MTDRFPPNFDQSQDFYTTTNAEETMPPFTVADVQPMPDFLFTGSLDPSMTDEFGLFAASDQMDQKLEQAMFDTSWPASPEDNINNSTGYSPLAINDATEMSTNARQEVVDDILFVPEASRHGTSDNLRLFNCPQPSIENTSQQLPNLQPRLPGSGKQPRIKQEMQEQSGRRTAHNLVERKYRDTLNTELERLRRAVPSIRNLDSATPDGRPRASKATVLSAAAEYIKKLEAEVCSQAVEIERLREACGRPARRRRQDI